MPEQSLLGESPLWSVAEQALYWVDIVAPALKRWEPGTARVSTIAMPEEIGCLGLAPDGGFVAAFRRGIWLLDRSGRRLRKLADNPEDTARSRFNDGGVDHLGRLWVGTQDERHEPCAGLYLLSGDRLTRVDAGLTISNGVAFSPDGKLAYRSDTPRRIVYRHAVDPETGDVGPRQPWLQIDRRPVDPGRPDGAAVDCMGCYWVALYEGGRIERYAPDGRLAATYAVPARCPTMVCFGGSDLRTLYITSARHERPPAELEQWPLSGALFSMRVETPGLPPHVFET